MSESQHSDAVLALINAALSSAYDPTVRAYEPDDVQAMTTKPLRYVEVTFHRRPSELSRLCTDKPTHLRRFLTRYVADTVTNANNLRDTTTTALEGVKVTVGAQQSTPVQFETGTPIERDDHWWSGQDAWTYAI